MNIFLRLLRDEAGLVLSAEAMVIGTLGVVGATAGLVAVSRSTNDELADTAFAIRSIDQSFQIEGDSRCGACIAGSKFTQQPVEESLKELLTQYEKDKAEEQKKLESAEKKQAANAHEDKLDPPKKDEPTPKKSPKARKHKKNKQPKSQKQDIERQPDEAQEADMPLSI